MRIHEYYTYIITNQRKTVLYTGITNSLQRRIAEHYFSAEAQKTFAGRYKCFNLVYYEMFKYVRDAIYWEKQIKGMSRLAKENLIKQRNPNWDFLNVKVMKWPPDEMYRRETRS
jgi:putative endonuclease